jgi:hypothetical protein
MNDIYDVFADAYQKETLGKKTQEKRGFSGMFASANDLESIPSISKKNIHSAGKVASTYSSVKDRLSGATDLPFALTNSKAVTQTDYTKAFVCFAISGFFILLAVFNLPALVLSPQIFNFFFTVAMLSLLVGIAFFNGPARYMEKLTSKGNVFATVLLLSSIVMSLYFSVIVGSYLWSLLFCFIQVSINFLLMSCVVKCSDLILL